MKDRIITYAVLLALSLGVIGFGLGIFNTQQTQPLTHATGSFNPTGGSTYRLVSPVSTAQNTITLSSFAEPVSGIPFTMTYLNSDIEYGTLDPLKTQSEFVSFSGITQNTDGSATLTGVIRGLARSPGTGGCVASTTLAQPHSAQSNFILSNSPCFQAEYATLRNNQTFSGLVTFTQPPIGINPGGSPNASVTVNGLVQLATARQAASSTGAGSTAAKDVIQSVYATDTPQNCSTPATGGCVVMALLNGKLSQLWLDLTQAFTFSNLVTFNTGGFINNASSTFTSTTNVSGALNVGGNATFTGTVTGSFPTVRYTFATTTALIKANGYASSTTLTIPAGLMTASSTITVSGAFSCAATVSGSGDNCSVYIRDFTGSGATIVSHTAFATTDSSTNVYSGTFSSRIFMNNSTSAEVSQFSCSYFIVSGSVLAGTMTACGDSAFASQNWANSFSIGAVVRATTNATVTLSNLFIEVDK